MVGEMDVDAVEPIRDQRAGGAAGTEIRPKHEVIDQKLGTAGEQVLQFRGPGLGDEAIGLVDLDPRQGLALPGDRVALPRQGLLRGQEIEAGLQPVLAGAGEMSRHDACSCRLTFAARRFAMRRRRQE